MVLGPVGMVAAITSSQMLDAVLEMEPVPFSETGCEITSRKLAGGRPHEQLGLAHANSNASSAPQGDLPPVAKHV